VQLSSRAADLRKGRDRYADASVDATLRYTSTLMCRHVDLVICVSMNIAKSHALWAIEMIGTEILELHAVLEHGVIVVRSDAATAPVAFIGPPRPLRRQNLVHQEKTDLCADDAQAL
jgi:hypothetical protein